MPLIHEYYLSDGTTDAIVEYKDVCKNNLWRSVYIFRLAYISKYN
jgi:hypothetical protein